MADLGTAEHSTRTIPTQGRADSAAAARPAVALAPTTFPGAWALVGGGATRPFTLH